VRGLRVKLPLAYSALLRALRETVLNLKEYKLCNSNNGVKGPAQCIPPRPPREKDTQLLT